MSQPTPTSSSSRAHPSGSTSSASSFHSTPRWTTWTLPQKQLIWTSSCATSTASNLAASSTRIAAEVSGEHFKLSDRLVSYLPALTSHDKPLYKLCQGSSYATRLIQLLGRRGQGLEPVTAHVIAVTNSGLESLNARFDAGEDNDLELGLCKHLGRHIATAAASVKTLRP